MESSPRKRPSLSPRETIRSAAGHPPERQESPNRAGEPDADRREPFTAGEPVTAYDDLWFERRPIS